MRLRVGQRVHVPCRIQGETLPEELLVSVETASGIITGFVRSAYVERGHGLSGWVEARVIEVRDDAVRVKIPGSFFTTASGIASLSPAWARSHLEQLPA